MNRRRILLTSTIDSNVVDLGLPSGTLWAKGNIVSDSSGGYRIGEETDKGAYFSWGNVDPHFSSNGSTFDDGYDWGYTNYMNSAGSSISFTSNHEGRDYTANTTNDAACAYLGGNWQVPTCTQFRELFRGTDSLWTTINGISGEKHMKKTDHSVYIFFPALGYGDGTSLRSNGSLGFYWSSSLASDYEGLCLGFGGPGARPPSHMYRWYGMQVRPVISY